MRAKMEQYQEVRRERAEDRRRCLGNSATNFSAAPHEHRQEPGSAASLIDRRTALEANCRAGAPAADARRTPPGPADVLRPPARARRRDLLPLVHDRQRVTSARSGAASEQSGAGVPRLSEVGQASRLSCPRAGGTPAPTSVGSPFRGASHRSKRTDRNRFTIAARTYEDLSLHFPPRLRRVLLLVTGCSSGVRVGTRHHHVAVGGSIGR